MIIQNFNSLATTTQRKHVLEIIEAGIGGVLPEKLVKSAIQYDGDARVLTVNGDIYDLSDGRIFVIGGGKAAGHMANALEDIIGVENIADGVVNHKGSSPATRKIRVMAAGHPIPDERGVRGVEDMLSLKERYDIGENDIVIALISGGGSALMPYPVEGISLEDKQAITELQLAQEQSSMILMPYASTYLK